MLFYSRTVLAMSTAKGNCLVWAFETNALIAVRVQHQSSQSDFVTCQLHSLQRWTWKLCSSCASNMHQHQWGYKDPSQWLVFQTASNHLCGGFQIRRPSYSFLKIPGLLIWKRHRNSAITALINIHSWVHTKASAISQISEQAYWLPKAKNWTLCKWLKAADT